MPERVAPAAAALALKLVLAPLLVAQALATRRRALVLPEADGAREGSVGSGGRRAAPAVAGDSSAAGVGVARQEQAVVGHLARSAARRDRRADRVGAARAHRSDDARRPRAARGPSHRRRPMSRSSSPASTTSSTRCRRGARCAHRAALADWLLGTAGVRHVVFAPLPPMHRFPLLPQPLRRVARRRCAPPRRRAGALGGDAQRRLARARRTRPRRRRHGRRRLSSRRAGLPHLRRGVRRARRAVVTTMSRHQLQGSVWSEKHEGFRLSAPLRWRVGDVTVTRIVESGGEASPLFASVSPSFLFSNLSKEAVQSQAWLKPHFATAEGRLIASIHAFVVESRGKTIVVDTCVGNDKVRDLPAWTPAQRPFPRRLRRRRLRARWRRHRAVHAPALRSRRLEHAPRRRPLGADVPARALPPESPRLRRPGRGRRRQRRARCWPIR